MRSAASCLLALAACGNYSDLDIPYFEALPASSQVQVAVPAASSQAVCSTATSDALADAQTAGGNMNTGIEDILALVDLIKALPPAKREPTSRQWGPWNDGKHPGFQTQVTMSEVDAGFTYELEEGPTGSATFTPLITGGFSGGEAADGGGSLTLDFNAAWTLGIADPTDPHGPLSVSYDLGSNPETIGVTLTQAGLSLQAFSYQWSRWTDGHGSFLFELQDPEGDVLTWKVSFLGDGSGSAIATGTSTSGASVTVTECWDSSACISYLNDPGNFSHQATCPANGPCDIGSSSACPAAIPDGGF
jgi:hypothetical protein